MTNKEHVSVVRCPKCKTEEGLHVHFVSRYTSQIKYVDEAGRIQYYMKAPSAFLPEAIECGCGHTWEIPEALKHAFVERYEDNKAVYSSLSVRRSKRPSIW